MSTDTATLEKPEDDTEGPSITVELAADPGAAVEVEKPDPEPDPAKPLAVEVAPDPVLAKVEPEKDPHADLRQQLESISKQAEEMRAARDAEAKRREEAEALALRMAEDRESQEVELIEARIQAVDGAMAAEKAEIERIESAMRRAHATKDTALLVKAQTALVKASRRLSDLEDGKVGLTQEREKLGERPKIVRPPQNQNSQPRDTAPPTYEQRIARYTPATQAYLRGRDQSWITDQSKMARLQAAHFNAVAEGLQADTDAYFKAVDRHMGHGVEAAPSPQKEAKPLPKTTPAAPGSSKGASRPNGGSVQVTLTPRQVQAAKDLGLPLAEYARRIHMMSQPNWSGPKLGQGN